MTQKYQGLARHALTFLGGLLVARGLITEGQLGEIMGAMGTLITLGGTFWSWLSKKDE